MRRALLLISVAFLPAASPAASFTLGAVLRAGGLTDNELQLGSTSGAPVATGDVTPTSWSEGYYHAFSLQYNAASNAATLTANWLGISNSSISWTVAGGSASSASRVWTIAPGGLLVSAQNNNRADTSITLTNLQLSGPGLAIINLPTLTAIQTGNGGGKVTDSNAAAVTFTTPNGQGTWTLTGNVQFTGLATVVPRGADGDGLRASLDITASDVTAVPEPATLLLTALGFAGLGVLYHVRCRRREPDAAAATKLKAGASTDVGPAS